MRIKTRARDMAASTLQAVEEVARRYGLPGSLSRLNDFADNVQRKRGDPAGEGEGSVALLGGRRQVSQLPGCRKIEAPEHLGQHPADSVVAGPSGTSCRVEGSRQ